MIAVPNFHETIRNALLLVTCTSLGACSDSSEQDAVLPEEIAIVAPQRAVTQLEIVEDLSEEAADWLLDFSDKLRRRDFTAAREWVSETFAGHGLSPLSSASADAEHLNSTHTKSIAE